MVPPNADRPEELNGASPGWRHRLLVAFWLIWAVVLLRAYYTRLWQLFAGDSSVWEALTQDILSTRGLAVFFAMGLIFLTVQLVDLNYIGHTLRRLAGDRLKSLFYRGAASLGMATIMAIGCFLLLRYLRAHGLAPGDLTILGEAAARTASGILGAGLVLLVAQVLGAGICQLLRWHPEDWREGLLYRTAVGLGTVSYLFLGLATLGIYRPLSIQILVAVTLSCGTLWAIHRLKHPRVHGYKIEGAANPATAEARHIGTRLWRAIALLAMLIAFVCTLAPEIEYDALWYHLWLPKLWLARGQPVDRVSEYISLYPMMWELIFGAGLVLGGPIAAKLLHFACLPLGGLLTYQLTRRFAPRVSPWLAVALFVTVPTVLWEATTAYVDLALTLHVGLVIYALLRYVERKRWQWLVLAAVNLGLALATKHLALIVLALSTGGLALRLWFEERNLPRALGPALLLGGLSLLLPLPWYVRAWLASGNPVFPTLYGLFGAMPSERWNLATERQLAHFQAHFGRVRTPLNLLTLPLDTTLHAARYGGSLGPMFLLLLPGLAVCRFRPRTTPWLMSFALLYVAFWASPVSSLQMRFLVPITPLLAVLAATSCSCLMHRLSGTWTMRLRPAFHGCVAALLLLNLPPFTSLHENDRTGWDGWLTHVIRQVPVTVVIGRTSQHDYLVRSVPSYAAWQYINTHLPKETRVLTFSGGDHFYGERDRIPADAAMAQKAVWLSTKGQELQALQAMHQLGISHVLFDKHQLESGQLDNLALAQPTTMASWYDLEYEDHLFVLYRIRWRQLTVQLEEQDR